MAEGITTPWLTDTAAIDYLIAGERTETGIRKRGPRWLRKQVTAGKLRAAKVGGRGQLLFRREWLDAFIEGHATPITMPGRRRA